MDRPVKEAELSGIYIRHETPNGKFRSVCLEDLPVHDQLAWLETLDREALLRTCLRLSEVLREMFVEVDKMVDDVVEFRESTE